MAGAEKVFNSLESGNFGLRGGGRGCELSKKYSIHLKAAILVGQGASYPLSLTAIRQIMIYLHLDLYQRLPDQCGLYQD